MVNKSLGLFITLEGGEGSGKSTLVEKIYDYLNKLYPDQVVKTFEPGGTNFGAKLRDILLKDESFLLNKKAELFLFLADRAQHVENIIRPALSDGKIIICDRYNDSSIAYQGSARLNDNIDEIDKICQFATGGLQPEITFYLDLDPKIGLARVKGSLDRLEKETIEFHQSVRDGFLKLAKDNSRRFCVIDANQSPNEVFLSVKGYIEQRLKNYA